MRFCDLFTEYKIEIKKFDKASKGVSWKKLPWQNKLLTILIVIITIVWTIFYVRNMQQMANWTLAILLIVIAIGLQIEETTSMLKFRLKKISRKYSKKRMKKVINLLKKHQINIHNIEGMKLLIETSSFYFLNIFEKYALQFYNHLYIFLISFAFHPKVLALVV